MARLYGGRETGAGPCNVSREALYHFLVLRLPAWPHPPSRRPDRPPSTGLQRPGTTRWWSGCWRPRRRSTRRLRCGMRHGADQARPQPALRPAVTEHTGQSRARMLCQQDLVAGSLPPRRCIRQRRSSLAWVNGLHLGPGLHLRKGSVTCDVRRVFRCSESCRTAAQRRRLELYARRLHVPAHAPS